MINIKINDLILLIIDYEGGQIEGKTFIQKIIYFISVFLDEDYGFKPHYYGPYSPLVEAGLGNLNGLGFIEINLQEMGLNRPGFELRRYDYALTDSGKKIVEQIKNSYKKEYEIIIGVLKKIKSSGSPNYLVLSVAAKIIHIIKSKGVPITKEQIVNEGKSLSWEINPSIIEEAAKFLSSMGLIIDES